MAVFRFVFIQPLLIILVSLSVSLALLYLGSLMGYEEFKGGYAVLSTDVSIDDRTLIALLNEEQTDFTKTGFFNIFGGKPVSESTQWVAFDNFESLETVALDNYFTRIFPFDPRNDGYAEKLKEIFVRDGKRFVYIPLAAGNWKSASLDKQISYLLKDIPFSVNYYGIGRPLFFFFIMYACASFCLLIICLALNKAHHGNLIIISLIPVLSSLAFFGASGIGCAALLFALFVVLKEPLSEVFTKEKGLQDNESEKKIKSKIIAPYKYHLLLLAAIIIAVGIIVTFSQLKFLFLIAVFTAALLVYLFSLKILSVSSIRHKRFTPVLIIKKRFPAFSFSFYMLPFTLAAFLTLFLSMYQTSSYISDVKFDNFVDEDEYYRHLEYQSSFSTRQFGSYNNAFPSFFFDTDGLPSIQATESYHQKDMIHTDLKHFPPFPLKHLMDFFHTVNSGKKTNSSDVQPGSLSEKLVLLILILFVIPGFFIKHKKDFKLKVDFSGFRKIAQETHGTGINWSKTLLYNVRKKNRSQAATIGRPLNGYRKDA